MKQQKIEFRPLDRCIRKPLSILTNSPGLWPTACQILRTSLLLLCYYMLYVIRRGSDFHDSILAASSRPPRGLLAASPSPTRNFSVLHETRSCLTRHQKNIGTSFENSHMPLDAPKNVPLDPSNSVWVTRSQEADLNS